MKLHLNQRIIRYGIGILLALLAGSQAVSAQQTAFSVSVAGGGVVGGQSSGSIAMSINGADIGAVLLKTCDLNHDGKVTLAELKEVAAACFKLWDTNAVGSLSQGELATGLAQFFPRPTAGGLCLVNANGVTTTVSPADMPTPDKEIAKHLMAAADANKDGSLSLQELNDYLDKCFSQWDQDGNGSLDAQELFAAFGQLAVPD
jgi:Ca2+-binding EF-hand superfamily protein